MFIGVDVVVYCHVSKELHAMFIVVDVVLYCHVLKELHACLSLLM